MYNEKFIAVIKSNGSILREKNNGEMYLPFGSEYTLLLKNENSRGASVKITIDDKDVLDNKRLFLLPNSEIELKGFLKDNKTTNSFRFIERTKEIEGYRGTKIDDGIIRIEYWFEKEVADAPIHRYYYYDHYYPHQWDNGWWDWHLWDKPYYSRVIWGDYTVSTIASGNTGVTNTDLGGSNSLIDKGRNVSCYYSSNNTVGTSNFVQCGSVPNSIKSEGITVKGSPIQQEFSQTYERYLESNSHVIIFKLVGYQEDTGNYVTSPVTVKTKATCETCGKECKSDENYCVKCGTWIDWS